MEIGLSTNDVKLITIIQQVCSVLSLVGCLFIITTFCLCDAFHKPINRLVFYASFGNIMASICFIMADSFIDAPDGAGCQTQAFLLHTYVHRQFRYDAWLICAVLLVLMRYGPLRWRLMFTLRSTIASMRSG